MRGWMRTLLLGAVFTVLLCTSALAAGERGMYDVTGSAGVALTAQTAAQGTPATASVTVDGAQKVVSLDAERIAMTYTGTAADTEYLVFVLKGDTTTPMADNIVYIDQKTGTGGDLSFDLYPSSLSSGIYTICMSTTSDAVAKIGSFGYYASYKLGDVDGDGSVKSRDALFVLQHVAELRPFSETQRLAADVDGIAGIRSRDALFILQAVADLRVLG